jgi:NTP pyrophosphatase (non-canonical NTP hydrolase)
MNKQEYLLVKTAEEAAEIAHACHKSLTFGLNSFQNEGDSTNKEQLEKELTDLLAMIKMLQDAGIIGIVGRKEGIVAKEQKVLRYMEMSRHLGVLNED